MKANDFKPLEIKDKGTIKHYLKEDAPETSELTFSNLFIWRHQYRPIWQIRHGCLLIILQPKGKLPFALPPVGAGDKKKALDNAFQDLQILTTDVMICRAGKTFVDQYVDPERYLFRLDRDNSDYLYLARDLIQLAGRKFHRKKNHVNRFKKNNTYEYRQLDIELVECFLDMQEHWCQIRECLEKPDLLSEDYAIHEALTHFQDLDYQGGAIIMDSNVEAFSLGESLNQETAVIHIEKANPDIPGLYAAINQLYCQNTWSEKTYINREQDLGIDGLRKAKESYYPHHMVDKYIITPR